MLSLHVKGADCETADFNSENHAQPRKKVERLSDGLKSAPAGDADEETISGYYDEYSQLETAYKTFDSLSVEITKSFQLIVKKSSPIAFLVSGANLENIRLFFEKICIECEKYDEETLTVLNEVFDYLFDQHRLNDSSYIRLPVQVGDDFDLDRHTRTSGSPPTGKVKRVIIAGFMKEGSTKKTKSYVEIG